MREILFRGKSTDDGAWMYGYYCAEGYGGCDFPCVLPNTDDGKDQHVSYCVDPTTVGQYTGLTDKNGAKIFEGDLLDGFAYPFESDGEHNYFAEVVWFENSPAFGLITYKHPSSKVRGISKGNTEYMEDFEANAWEVIGNIHDTPELLVGTP